MKAGPEAPRDGETKRIARGLPSRLLKDRALNPWPLSGTATYDLIVDRLRSHEVNDVETHLEARVSQQPSCAGHQSADLPGIRHDRVRDPNPAKGHVLTGYPGAEDQPRDSSTAAQGGDDHVGFRDLARSHLLPEFQSRVYSAEHPQRIGTARRYPGRPSEAGRVSPGPDYRERQFPLCIGKKYPRPTFGRGEGTRNTSDPGLRKEANRHVLLPALGVEGERGDIGRSVAAHRYDPGPGTGKDPFEGPKFVPPWAVPGTLVFTLYRERGESQFASELGMSLDRGREPPQRNAGDRNPEALL